MRNEYDLAIVGASFSGLACATAAAARGVRTLVIDGKPEPGANVRTTGLLVKEAADEWDVPRRLTRKIHGVRLYSPSRQHVDLHSPGYYFLATNTAALMRWFSSLAFVANVKVQNATRFRGAAPTGDGFQLDAAGAETRCRYLVGADGPRSSVARWFGLGRNERFLTGLELEFEGVSGIDEDLLHVFVDSKLAPGYIAWVVPGVKITQVGLACSPPHRPDVDAFVRSLGGLFDFSAARVAGRRGGLIPVGGLVKRWAAPGVMLVGDAAGMVSPLTAGGIQTAMHFGRCAGVAVADYLLDAGPAPERVIRPLLPSFMFKRMMRTAIDLRPPNFMLDLALQTPPIRGLAQAVFYHHRGLFSPAAWRDMVLAWR